MRSKPPFLFLADSYKDRSHQTKNKYRKQVIIHVMMVICHIPVGSHHYHLMNPLNHFHHYSMIDIEFMLRKKIEKEKSQNDLKFMRVLPDLCEKPSLPEPEPAFPLSPALAHVFAEVPFGFLDESLSFPSGPFPSNSVVWCMALGV
jgi:hypothetical protein